MLYAAIAIPFHVSPIPCTGTAISTPARAPEAGVQLQPTMDLTFLDQAVCGYLKCCVTPSTLSSYASAQCHYVSFCKRAAVVDPFPIREHTLCRYVACLGQKNLKHRTIKAYLSALRFVQMQWGMGDPFQQTPMHLLEYGLSGIEQSQAIPHKPWLPITPQILAKNSSSGGSSAPHLMMA